MRDIVISVVVLTWTFVAVHTGSTQIGSLFGLVNASLEQMLAHMG